ncbi:MAG: hypothetical protein JXA64_09260 [Candidatus Fermentibacteraceae bacterium]|nr:hypothetical protein [Candidatus Fermentibacteraceae bacterium]
MKSMGICLSLFIIVLSALPAPPAAGQVPPVRAASLDSLARDISTLGYIPSGGEFAVLAASSGWFGLISGVRLLPGNSAELAELLEDTTGEQAYYGISTWSPGGDIVLVNAPAVTCWPVGVRPSVAENETVSFSLEGYWQLRKPEVAVGTPEMEIIDLYPDSSGRFGFRVDSEGVYWVEVMQQTEGGPSIELLFPIISGGEAADVFSGRLGPTGSSAGSPEEILDELNTLRAQKGIPELSRSAMLDWVAACRAGNLAISGSVNHIDRVAGSLDQLMPPGIRVYGENIGKGRGYQEAWSMILISPFHLRTCLSGEYTRVGLAGAVECSSYQWQLVMVQVFSEGTVTE